MRIDDREVFSAGLEGEKPIGDAHSVVVFGGIFCFLLKFTFAIMQLSCQSEI